MIWHSCLIDHLLSSSLAKANTKSQEKKSILLKKMASLNGISKATDEKFPAADINGELNPGQNKDVNVDPVSSEITTSLQIKKQAETEEKKKGREKKEAMQKLKSAVIISAVVVAVAGAAFAITKKLREK